MKTVQELLSRPVSLWPNGLGLQLNFCCFVRKIPVAVLLQTLLLFREGIESWVGVFYFFVPLLRSPFVSKSSNSAAQQRKLPSPAHTCSTIHGLC